jgi:1-acyl-sn-glycerol-3-phosphate acyltransferase
MQWQGGTLLAKGERNMPEKTSSESEGDLQTGPAVANPEKFLMGKYAGRNLALLGLFAAPWVGFLALALRPSPRQMWAQRWPTLTFVGLYQIALDSCVEIEGLEHLPQTGPVILAGNHINKTAMDALLLGSKILIERGGLAKFVSIADPPDRMLKHFVRLMGHSEGVLLPIQKGGTTASMIEFLRNPATYKREQPILGIFPAGNADRDFETNMTRQWHTGAAVTAFETGAPIVPFFVEGLPYHWRPLDMLKAVARSLVGDKAFEFKVRFGPPIWPQEIPQRSPAEMIERVRQAVLELGIKSIGQQA